MGVPGEETFTPGAFLRAWDTGPVCRRDGEALCGKLMRPQGLAARPAHMAGWHGSQHVSTARQTQVP